MAATIGLIIGLVLALAGTVLAIIMLIPAGKGKTLKGFWLWLHNFFNGKYMFLETIIKVIYIFTTLLCVFVGFFLLFCKTGWYWTSSSTALYGILLMILGPIASRVVYEVLLLFITAVKNLVQINGKLKECGASEEKEAEASAEEAKASDSETPDEKKTGFFDGKTEIFTTVFNFDKEKKAKPAPAPQPAYQQPAAAPYQQPTYQQPAYQQPAAAPYQQPAAAPYQQPAAAPYQQPAAAPYQSQPAQQSAAAPATVYCPNCGSAVEPGDVFCNKCGTKVR